MNYDDLLMPKIVRYRDDHNEYEDYTVLDRMMWQLECDGGKPKRNRLLNVEDVFNEQLDKEVDGLFFAINQYEPHGAEQTFKEYVEELYDRCRMLISGDQQTMADALRNNRFQYIEDCATRVSMSADIFWVEAMSYISKGHYIFDLIVRYITSYSKHYEAYFKALPRHALSDNQLVYLMKNCSITQFKSIADFSMGEQSKLVFTEKLRDVGRLERIEMHKGSNDDLSGIFFHVAMQDPDREFLENEVNSVVSRVAWHQVEKKDVPAFMAAAKACGATSLYERLEKEYLTFNWR